MSDEYFCYDWDWVKNPEPGSFGRTRLGQKRHYCCVSDAVISQLPGIPQGVSPGSTAITKTGNTYMLWPDNTWSVI